jgi:hypothetical protein
VIVHDSGNGTKPYDKGNQIAPTIVHGLKWIGWPGSDRSQSPCNAQGSA